MKSELETTIDKVVSQFDAILAKIDEINGNLAKGKAALENAILEIQDGEFCPICNQPLNVDDAGYCVHCKNPIVDV